VAGLYGSRSRAARRAAVPGQPHRGQSAELRSHSLCRGAAHPAPHDLHHAVERHAQLPSSLRPDRSQRRIAGWRTSSPTGSST
jgi:hypothetical protein